MALKSKLILSFALLMLLSQNNQVNGIQKRHHHQRQYMQLSQEFIEDQEEFSAQNQKNVNQVLKNLESTDKKFKAGYYQPPKQEIKPAVVFNQAKIDKAERILKKQQQLKNDGIDQDVIAFNQIENDHDFIQTGETFIEDQEEFSAQNQKNVNQVLKKLESTDKKFKAEYYQPPKQEIKPAVVVNQAKIEKAERILKKQHQLNKNDGIDQDVIAFNQVENDHDFIQTGQTFIEDQEQFSAQDSKNVNQILNNLEQTKQRFQQGYMTPQKTEQAQQVVLDIKKDVVSKADRIFSKQQIANKQDGIDQDVIAFAQSEQQNDHQAQNGIAQPQQSFAQSQDSSQGEIPRQKIEQIQALQDEIEKVYNFERDIATAKVQDEKFEKRVNLINDYMSKYRRTYQDSDYLRDPLPNQFESAKRKMQDQEKRNFEAIKQALDIQKTKYQILQSEAVANAAENSH